MSARDIEDKSKARKKCLRIYVDSFSTVDKKGNS
jgi:hypothetical protein